MIEGEETTKASAPNRATDGKITEEEAAIIIATDKTAIMEGMSTRNPILYFLTPVFTLLFPSSRVQ